MAASSYSSSSSSSSSPSYDVFPSFSGEDVRRSFLSHVLAFFKRKTIKTFEDGKIQKGETIGPELIQAIRASKISILVFSKKYASSSWCLNELLEIMDCKEAAKQKVITIFYEVDPSDVRKQTGDFGKAFEKTCVGKTEEKKQGWSKALTDAANIAGYHSHNWSNEADMIKEIATDVLNKLNRLTIPKDFDGLVGMEGHLTKIESLLCPKSNEVRMIGILGPRGIGKTTIARALYHHLSRDFELSCFVENIRGRFGRTHHDAYSYQLYLQQEFLSLILDDKSLRVNHSRVVEERLSNHRVFVVLDDVDGIEQLQALADKTHWFGAKSKIVVITENKDLLVRHGINYTYEVNLPSQDEALQIFCQYAFRQNSPLDGFYELAKKVAELASSLPLGLSVLGSSLYGRSEDEWRKRLPRLQGRLDGKIERELRVGYDCLDEKDQAIFRHIACMFPQAFIDDVKSMLDDSDLDIELGLETLAHNYLIQISRDGWIEMHDLLQQTGREIVREQNTKEPGKREFLVEFNDIKDVLTNDTGTNTVLGISTGPDHLNQDFLIRNGRVSLGFDHQNQDELSINGRAFERMTSLRFLRIDVFSRVKMQLPQGLSSLPPKLRLLEWYDYPLNSLPPGFCPKHLIELTMRCTELEKLWKGKKPLGRLKRMDLSWSRKLKEIPDLSEATNLEVLGLEACSSSIVLPPFIGHLHKLKSLSLSNWESLEVLPTTINLTSLIVLSCGSCSKLRCFPKISQSVEYIYLSMTAIEEVPSSVAHWPRLTKLSMSKCKNLKTFPNVPNCIKILELSMTGIEEVPSRIENLFQLCELKMRRCKKLRNISSNIFKLVNLKEVVFTGCENLESFLPSPREKAFGTLDLTSNDFESTPGQSEIPCKLDTPERISPAFNNKSSMLLLLETCFKLNEEAREFIQESVCRCAILPGTKLPPYISHQASGSSLTISSEKMPVSGFLDSKPYLLLAAILNLGLDRTRRIMECYVNFQHGNVGFQRDWIITSYGYEMPEEYVQPGEHLIIFRISDWPKENDVPRDELSHEHRVLEFTFVPPKDCEVKEFGVYFLDSTYVCEKEESNFDTYEGNQSTSSNLPSDIDPYQPWLLLF